MKGEKLMNNECTKLIKTDSIFYKIKFFFRKLFRNNLKSQDETTNIKLESDNKFRNSIAIENTFEKNRLLDLQDRIKNNQIDENSISKEDIEKLSSLYDKQIQELKERIKQNILNTDKYKKEIIAMKKQIN